MVKIPLTFACGLYDRMLAAFLLGKWAVSGGIATQMPPNVFSIHFAAPRLAISGAWVFPDAPKPPEHGLSKL